METYKGSVYIGRFQPFHLGHLEVLQQALDCSEKVLIIIGSSRSTRTIKNPFNYEERRNFIRASLKHQDRDRVIFEEQRDYYYDDSQWYLSITEKIKKHFKLTDSLGLFGSYKDQSSYYLKMFPFLEYVPFNGTGHFQHINATAVRSCIFDPYSEDHVQSWSDKRIPRPWKNKVPSAVFAGVSRVLLENLELYEKLRDEYTYIKNYKKQWEKSPYPPTFVTADYVLRCGGHVLVIRRKLGHGKGNIALPGGFVRAKEPVREAAVRELREETSLNLSAEQLNLAIKKTKVFDHPDRSLRGRTITHAFYGNIPFEGELPRVEGSDDAAEAFWIPIFEIYEKSDEFFEDHFHIIHHFITGEE